VRRKSLFEALEQRFLLSAELFVPPPQDQPIAPVIEAPLNIDVAAQTDLLAAGQVPFDFSGMDAAGVDGPQIVELDASLQRVLPASSLVDLAAYAAHAQVAEPVSQLVIIDAAVADPEQLLAGIFASHGQTGTGVLTSEPQASAAEQLRIYQQGQLAVVILDGIHEGLEQISTILGAHHDLDAVQIVSHGKAGAIMLGGQWLDADLLASERDQIAAWGNALKDDGDLLLYGCDVAADDGAAFIKALASVTGADVAASSNASGSSTLGGDWTLEQQVGTITAAPLFESLAFDGYDFLLAVPTGTAGADTFVISAASLTRTGGSPVTFGATETLSIDGLAGDDTFTVKTMPTTTGSLTLIGGANTVIGDTVDLSSFAANMTVTMSRAGELGRITIATNMAGRGTDIKLGPGVAEVGGVYVILSERSEAGRIDRQLAGRCARQGDPGTVEAMLSLEDALLASAGKGLIRWLAQGRTPGEAQKAALIRHAQRRMERGQARIRAGLLKADQQLGNVLSFSGRPE